MWPSLGCSQAGAGAKPGLKQAGVGARVGSRLVCGPDWGWDPLGRLDGSYPKQIGWGGVAASSSVGYPSEIGSKMSPIFVIFLFFYTFY